MLSPSMPEQSLGFVEDPDSPEGLKSSLRRTHLRSSSMPSSQDSELLLHIPPRRKLSSLFFGPVHDIVLMLCVVSSCLPPVRSSGDQCSLHNYKDCVRSRVCIKLGSVHCCNQLDFKCDDTLALLLRLQHWSNVQRPQALTSGAVLQLKAGRG